MNLVLPEVRAKCKCVLCKSVVEIDIDFAYPGSVIEAVLGSAENDIQTGFYTNDIFVCVECFDAYVDMHPEISDGDMIQSILSEYKLIN